MIFIESVFQVDLFLGSATAWGGVPPLEGICSCCGGGGYPPRDQNTNCCCGEHGTLVEAIMKDVPGHGSAHAADPQIDDFPTFLNVFDFAGSNKAATYGYAHLRHTRLTRRIDPLSRFEAGGPDLWATRCRRTVPGATGRCPVATGRYPVATGHYPVATGRYPVATGR
jgi:hypothetical protein